MPRLTRSQARKAVSDAVEDNNVQSEEISASTKSNRRATRATKAKDVVKGITSPICAESKPEAPVSPVRTRTRVLRSSTVSEKTSTQKIRIPTIQIEEVVAEELNGADEAQCSIEPTTTETPLPNESQSSDNCSDQIAESNRKRPSRSIKSVLTNNGPKSKTSKSSTVDAEPGDDSSPTLRKSTRSRSTRKDQEEIGHTPDEDTKPLRSTRLRKAASLKKSEEDIVAISPKKPAQSERIEQPTIAPTTRKPVVRNTRSLNMPNKKETTAEAPSSQRNSRGSRQTMVAAKAMSNYKNAVTLAAQLECKDDATDVQDTNTQVSTLLSTNQKEPSKIQVIETINTSSLIILGETPVKMQNYINQPSMDRTTAYPSTSQPVADIITSLVAGRALLREGKSHSSSDHSALLALCNLEPLDTPKRQPATARGNLSEALEIEDQGNDVDVIKTLPTFNLETDGQDKENSPMAPSPRKNVKPHTQRSTKQASGQAPKQSVSTPTFKTPSKPLPKHISTPVSKPVFNQISTPVSRQLSKQVSTPTSKQVSKNSSAAATATPRSIKSSATATVNMTKAAKLRAENIAATKDKGTIVNKPSTLHKPIHSRNAIDRKSPVKVNSNTSKIEGKETSTVNLGPPKHKPAVHSAVKPNDKKAGPPQIPTQEKTATSTSTSTSRISTSVTPAKMARTKMSPAKPSQREVTTSKTVTKTSSPNKAGISEDAMIKRLLALPPPPKTYPSESTPAKSIPSKASLPNLASTIVSPSKTPKTVDRQPVSKTVSKAKVTHVSVPLKHSPVKKSIASGQPSPRKPAPPKAIDVRERHPQGTDAVRAPAGKSQVGAVKKRMAAAPKPISKSTKPLTKPSFELSGVARSKELAEIRAERTRKLEELEKTRKEKCSPIKKTTTKQIVAQQVSTTRAAKALPTLEKKGSNLKGRPAARGGVASPLENGSSSSTSLKPISILSEPTSSSLAKQDPFPALDKTPTDIYPTLKTIVQMNNGNHSVQSPQASKEDMQRREAERLQARMRGMQAVNEWAAKHGVQAATKAA